MSKFLLICVVFCLAVTLITARTPNNRLVKSVSGNTCKKHGDDCVDSSECCSNVKMQCHLYARRCQVIITADELMEQREKILGRRGKDY